MAIAELEKEIDDINKRAWESRVSDSLLAFDLSREAIEKSAQCGYKKGQAQSLRTHAFCMIRLSEHDKAIPLLTTAQILFGELKDEYGLSDLQEYFGIIARSKGDYSDSLHHLYESLSIREQIDYKEGISLSLYHLGVTYRYMGNLEQALDIFLKELAYSRAEVEWIGESYTLNNIGTIYFELGEYSNALNYFNQSLELRTMSGDKWGMAGCLDNIGLTYLKLEQFNEAVEYCSTGLAISASVDDKKGQGNSLFHLAEIFLKKGDRKLAMTEARRSLLIRESTGDRKGQAEVYCFLGAIDLYSDLETIPNNELLNFLEKAQDLGNTTGAQDLISRIHHNYFLLLKKMLRFEEALNHLEEHSRIEKDIHSYTLRQKMLNLEIKYRVEQSQKEAQLLKEKNQELAGLNAELKIQKDETDVQRNIAEASLIELQETQKQLIQREKLASLGELTAGIAHEIQNPLNFVNNFAEVNRELIDELVIEAENGSLDGVKKIVTDLKNNEEKIYSHGKRADNIIKNMLRHSGIAINQKELCDINKLCEETIDFCVDNWKADAKDIKVTLKKNYDTGLNKIHIVSQDISRVLINLLNNAFYAIREKSEEGDVLYSPVIEIQTKHLISNAGITISDNGSGISTDIIDKIFQPFFTTKPTGQGTGLGLSLAYDIVTREHSGTLKVQSSPGDGSFFYIELPIG